MCASSATLPVPCLPLCHAQPHAVLLTAWAVQIKENRMAALTANKGSTKGSKTTRNVDPAKKGQKLRGNFAAEERTVGATVRPSAHVL